MYYSFTGMTADGLYRYHVTLKLYRDCFSAGAQLDDNAAIGIFNRTTNTLVYNQRIPKAKTERLQLNTPGPCITNAPTVCYEVGYYEFDISLTANNNSILSDKFCTIIFWGIGYNICTWYVSRISSTLAPLMKSGC